jgi:hypothetical protein
MGKTKNLGALTSYLSPNLIDGITQSLYELKHAPSRVDENPEHCQGWVLRVGRLAGSFYYLEQGAPLMNRPSSTHSFTHEKVRQEAIELVAKTICLIHALDDEIELNEAKS